MRNSFQLAEEFRQLICSEDGPPEKKLLAAVIGRALADWVGLAQTEQHYRRSARAWLFRNSKRKFSCNWCLQELDLLENKEQLLRNVKENGFTF